MRRRRSGKAYRKQFCSIILAAALAMGSVMPAFAAEGGTIASEETAAVSESAAENGTVDETEQITSGEGTEQVTSGDGTEQVTSGDGTDKVTTDDDQAATDDQENPEEGEPAPGEETDVVADQNTGLDPEANEPVEGATVPEVSVSFVEGIGDDDSEEMFAEYVERLFEGEDTRKRAKKAVGSKFEGASLYLYTELRNGAEQVASGQRASTEFAFEVEDLGFGSSNAWSASELGVEAVVVGGSITQEAANAAFARAREELQDKAVIDALLADCPYELYWYDKTVGYNGGSSIGATKIGGEWKCYISGQYTFSFAVASEFSAGQYTADTNKTGAATAAVSNAQDILSAASGLSDIEKLNYYKEEICDLVSYNNAAAGGGIAYGNPWQLVWVFDGDTSTNVVCEGYSKAFQYLCDKTNFSSNRVSVISPTGVMSGGTGEGRHMWNIVTLDDGWNYLADVTNSDTGTAGSNGDLFLVPYTSGSVENGYTFLCFGTDEIHYSYDADCIDLFSAENLTLSANPYGTNPLPEPLEITSQPQDIIATDGQNITLHVEANKTDVSYQWQWSEDGENWENCTFDGAFTDTLSFLAKEIVHGMYFRCVVSDTNESVNSEAAQVMVDSIEHSYGDWVVTVEPTCTEDGSREKVCTICGDKVTEAIPATGHAYGDWTVTTAATCTADGSKEKVCANCGDKITETIPATGHAYGDWTVTKEATCTEDGSREKVCGNCGDKITETISATGHVWEDEYTVDKEATCSEEGSESIHCSVCGAINETTVRSIAKTEHTYGDWTVTKEPTCTEDGNREKVCANCGDKITEEIPATGHAWSEWTVVREATEEEEGLERRTCSNDPSHTEEKIIPKLTHVHELTKTEAKEASCTEDGNIEFWTCSKCGRVYSDSEGVDEINPEETVIHAVGHKWNTEYTVDKEATCTEEGSESIHCSVCGAIDETTVRVIPKKEHTYGDWTVTKEATCTEDGSREKVCANCGDKIIETIPAIGHAYGDWTVTKEATCTEDGSREKVCANCGDKVTETILAIGHVWEDEYTVDKEATCAEEGSESIHCSVCGAIDETTIRAIAKTEHAYGEWTVTKGATCTEDGSREKVCANCGDKITETIPATGHAYSDWTVTKEATCTEDGSKEKVCSSCGDKITETIPATGHAYSDWTVTKEATCTEDGSREKVCANCGDKITETISATGHVWEEEYTVDKEATCTEEGSESIHCSVCGAINETTVRVIPKTEHAYGDWTVTKEATCTEDGSREKVCANCGDKIAETIPAIGHAYGDWTVTTEPTCTEDGSQERICANCGDKETKTISATGHIWNDYYTRDVEPTETEEGSESIHCSVCNAINEETIRPIPVLVLKGTWKQDRNGWWYDRGNGTYPKDGFEEIEGVTYYFNASGYMKTGWVQDDGAWYYFAASGAMVKEHWQQSGSAWYYFGDDGKMVTGQKEINGTSYFFKDSGAMATGWQEIDGDWYYFAGSGAMVKDNWQQIGSVWYYFGEDGKMLTGQKEINGTSYFFKDSGAMATGWQQIDGDWYYFNASGAMVKENWLSSGGKWYYFDEDGKMVIGFKEIGDNEYYFNASGAMLTGWQEIDGAWYYFEASGAMVRSRWVGDYYMLEDGVMATDQWIGDYYVGPDGKWISGMEKVN